MPLVPEDNKVKKWRSVTLTEWKADGMRTTASLNTDTKWFIATLLGAFTDRHSAEKVRYNGEEEATDTDNDESQRNGTLDSIGSKGIQDLRNTLYNSVHCWRSNELAIRSLCYEDA